MVPRESSPLDRLSDLPHNPSFQDSAVNVVAVVPLLSGTSPSNSEQAFNTLFDALKRHTGASTVEKSSSLLLVVPNSGLTRPGDWSYSETPLKVFHWQHGCQRFRFFDGRPDISPLAHDRLKNHKVTQEWIDFLPCRRTAVVIGVLNLRDCASAEDLKRAEDELKSWVDEYSVSTYCQGKFGRESARDIPVQRLFVYDSFDEECQTIDITKCSPDSRMIAFPSNDREHMAMMDVHLNLVINDIAVDVLRDLEAKIQGSDAIAGGNSSISRRPFNRILSGPSSSEEPMSPSNLSAGRMANLVGDDNILSGDVVPSDEDKANMSSNDAPVEIESTDVGAEHTAASSRVVDSPLLLSPMDGDIDPGHLSERDMEAVKRRDIGRREKYAADLSLLAGSPLDAYERYLKAGEYCKGSTPDPLWYAGSLEGCAAAHIAMADAGGWSVDEYLLANFQVPVEFLVGVKRGKDEKASRLNLPEVVDALCDEAVKLLIRHQLLAPHLGTLLLKMAHYHASSSERHILCRWGEGKCCFGGEAGAQRRWENESASIVYDEGLLKENKVLSSYTIKRMSRFSELLHLAVSIGCLSPHSRVDVATRCSTLCLNGVMAQSISLGASPRHQVRLFRKAAFFATVAADYSHGTSTRSLWEAANALYSRSNRYGWAVIRASCLRVLSFQNDAIGGLSAAQRLLDLLSEMEMSTEFSSSVEEEHPDSDDDKNEIASRDDDTENSTTSMVVLDDAQDTPQGEKPDGNKGGKANLFAQQLREGFQAITSSSNYLAEQSKWANSEAVPPVDVPLGDSSPNAEFAVALASVWLNEGSAMCTEAQEKCAARVQQLRMSSSASTRASVSYQNLSFLEVKIVDFVGAKSKRSINVQNVKNTEKGSMATFYSPFSKARNTTKETVVCANEERFAIIEFSNKLAIPVEICDCQLVMTGKLSSVVRAPTVSFAIPPRTKGFRVHLPYITEHSLEQDKFEGLVDAITFTCLASGHRVDNSTSFSSLIPRPRAEYLSKVASKPVAVQPLSLRSHCAQPHLEIICSKTGRFISTLTVAAPKGALYTSKLLSFQVLQGHVEVLHIQCRYGENTFQDMSVVEDNQRDLQLTFQELSNDKSLFARVVAEKLPLIETGDPLSQLCRSFRLQIAQSGMNRIPVQIRFRYCGKSTATAKLWKKIDFTMFIAPIDGPSIESNVRRLQPSDQTNCSCVTIANPLNSPIRLKHVETRSRACTSIDANGTAVVVTSSEVISWYWELQPRDGSMLCGVIQDESRSLQIDSTRALMVTMLVNDGQVSSQAVQVGITASPAVRLSVVVVGGLQGDHVNIKISVCSSEKSSPVEWSGKKECNVPSTLGKARHNVTVFPTKAGLYTVLAQATFGSSKSQIASCTFEAFDIV